MYDSVHPNWTKRIDGKRDSHLLERAKTISEKKTLLIQTIPMYKSSLSFFPQNSFFFGFKEILDLVLEGF